MASSTNLSITLKGVTVETFILLEGEVFSIFVGNHNFTVLFGHVKLLVLMDEPQ